jgi:hypothetical protein
MGICATALTCAASDRMEDKERLQRIAQLGRALQFVVQLVLVLGPIHAVAVRPTLDRR